MKNKIEITWEVLFRDLAAFKVSSVYPVYVYGVPKGGMIITGFLSSLYPNIKQTSHPEQASVIIDDIEDSGKTRSYYKSRFPNIPFHSLYKSADYPNSWLVFPWEKDHPGGASVDTIEDNIVRILQYIGENPSRDGLIKTPRRVIQSFTELYAGYGKDPETVFTTFENDGDYDSMVLLKDIELHSTCEHHMLPFYGRAHVAYIPGDGTGITEKKIIGISKLARLVDIFSKRLQVQERICEQVTSAIMQYLKPKGAACVIEAVHMCMCSRGVGKQHSSMVTSSVKGVFRSDLAVREEFINLIRKS